MYPLKSSEISLMWKRNSTEMTYLNKMDKKYIHLNYMMIDKHTQTKKMQIAEEIPRNQYY